MLERYRFTRAPATAEPEEPVQGRVVPVSQRLGQGAFRVLVTDTYERRCAVTGEKDLPALGEARMQPVAGGGPHSVSNGLLLRSDVHMLYDRGYVTIAPDLRFRVIRRLKKDFDNGEHYHQLDGSTIWVPRGADERPRRELLEWHADTVFRG